MDTEKLLEAINLLNTKLDALSTRVDELDATIFDDLLNPMNEYVVNREHEDGVNAFGEKYPSIAEAGEDYKALYGTDLASDIYDAYQPYKEEYEEDSFVSEALRAIKEEIDNIKTKLGVKVEVKEVDKDGDGTAETLEVTDKEEAKEPEEKEEPEEVKEEKEEKEEETIDSPEEIAEFEKSLEQYK